VRSVVVTGAAGFVGRAVLADAAARTGIRVTAVTHAGSAVVPLLMRDMSGRRSRPSTGLLRCVAADLDDPESLDGLVDGADAVIHLAHRLTGTTAELITTNVDGTAAVASRVQAAGVPRLVSLSTAAVYDAAAGRITPQTTPAPQSPTSQSRLRSDEIVLASGGTVVRPHLVHGPGDQWFLPRAMEITRKIGWIDGGHTRHSIICVAELARTLVDLALKDPEPAPLVLVGPHTPPTIREFLTQQAQPRGERLPAIDISLLSARHHPGGYGDSRWEHDLHLLSTETILTPIARTLRAGVRPRQRTSTQPLSNRSSPTLVTEPGPAACGSLPYRVAGILLPFDAQSLIKVVTLPTSVVDDAGWPEHRPRSTPHRGGQTTWPRDDGAATGA